MAAMQAQHRAVAFLDGMRDALKGQFGDLTTQYLGLGNHRNELLSRVRVVFYNRAVDSERKLSTVVEWMLCDFPNGQGVALTSSIEKNLVLKVINLYITGNDSQSALILENISRVPKTVQLVPLWTIAENLTRVRSCTDIPGVQQCATQAMDAMFACIPARRAGWLNTWMTMLQALEGLLE